MQRVLPWTFLIVGVLVGYLAGLGTRPVPGPVPPPPPGSVTSPGDSLPFALKTCTGDCVGEVELFTGTKPSSDAPSDPPHGAPSPMRSSHPSSIISNMSANKGGLARDVTGGGGRQPVFAITIPEDPDDHYAHRRLQTLYIEHGTSYRLATCLVSDEYEITQYCGHDGTISHYK